MLAVKGWGLSGGGAIFPVGVIPVNNGSNIPLETLRHYGCPLFSVKVGILLANKGINSQGILGNFIVTFGNDSAKGQKSFRVLSKLFRIFFIVDKTNVFGPNLLKACLTAVKQAVDLLSEPDDGYC